MLRVATIQITQKEKREFENQWATENSMHPDMVH